MPRKRPSHDSSDAQQITGSQPEKILTDLDPRLQEAILAHRSAQPLDRAVSREADDGSHLVDVLAKLADPGKAVPGLNIVRAIGPVVTGTVAVEDIEAVRKHENVISLKGATEVRPNLGTSVRDIEATPAQLTGIGASPVTGQGVIVGIVDFGFDFVHRNLRRPDGTTRLLFLWDQSGGPTSMSPAGFDYGREFTAATINAALANEATADPYQALAYDPGLEAHGTHVSDIAAGNGGATGRPGVAPGADYIFVDLQGGDVRPDESFGNSRQLLEAVDYIFEKAAQLGRRAVVNMSLGTHGGPHDGSTLAELGFDHLLQTPGRAIVISAGNSFQRGSHASGTVTTAAPRVLGWEISAGDLTGNELEVWYPGGLGLDVALTPPGGSKIGPVRPGSTVTLQNGTTRVGNIISRENDPNNGDNQINILLAAGLPTGTWKVELTSAGAQGVPFHAWIERDDRGQSGFAAADTDTTHTIGSISCSENTITVGSFSALVPAHDISKFSAEGPTRNGRQKPEVSAPGQNILAASSKTQDAIRFSGTSMAAPHVTGLVALLHQVAPQALTIDEIRAAVIDACRKDPPAGTGWNGRYGFGRVSAREALLSQVQPAVPPVAAIPVAVLNGHGAGLAASAAEEGVPLSPVADLLLQLGEVATRSRSRIKIEVEVAPV